MTAAQKHEITIFGTVSQRDEVRASNWFEPSKHTVAITDRDFDKVLQSEILGKNPIFIALSKSVLNHFLKYLADKIIDNNMVGSFYKSKPSLISFKDMNLDEERIVIDDLFEDVIFNKKRNLTLLEKEELMFVLSKPLSERRDRVIGVQVLKGLKKIKLLRGNFESLYVPMENFETTTQGVEPDFDDLEVMEYGHYIRLGDYEAAVTGVLYECDKDYRLRRKKERLENEISFGACLRRYRIQKKIRQSDLENTSEKTIRRIEDGENPTNSTKAKILNEFISKDLPEWALEDIKAFLQTTNCPIAVRSSSILEDSNYQPFAGVFSTYMVPDSEIDKKVADVLERVSLPDAGPKDVAQLSGGQRQRIAIARSLVLEPAVLLLDEPLGALDLKLREHMKVELKQLQHEVGTTFVYITHDQSEALVMSDNVAVMNEGRFEQVGSPQDLYYNPKTAFVAGFVGDSNRWSGRVDTIDNGQALVSLDDGGVIAGITGNEKTLTVGDKVELFVRPEAITIERDSSAQAGAHLEDGQNTLSGLVENLLFDGANSRAQVRDQQTGHQVTVSLPQTGAFSDLKSGEQLRLSWGVDKARAYVSPTGTSSGLGKEQAA
ncbi:ATP-binding cassette domain-containing protein [uncultured Kiloniella sp.]|mgnify:CR=1 FL=1|uniref:ABC transporter ATP-binding protein n=1 Tax=uncultured Kiloniella sp. TaxID=1133091 RepID=UPI002615256F|nr:ATP-binding cassette domain-containing protein [uncultured Kiloniella sp.]